MSKIVKLKPFFLKDDEIFIEPPDASTSRRSRSTKPESSNWVVVSDLDSVKKMLRGRKLRKKTTSKTRKQEEQEQVENLNEWKYRDPNSPVSPASPIKKVSFRRGLTTVENSKGLSYLSKQLQLITSKTQDYSKDIKTTLQAVLSQERAQKKDEDEMQKKITAENTEYEDYYKKRMDYLKNKILQLKSSQGDIIQKLEATKNEISEIETKYEKDMGELKRQEIMQTLFKSKLKESNDIKLGDESLFYIRREQIRKKAQETHDQHIKDKEEAQNKLKKTKKEVESCKRERRKAKKQLKEVKETLVNLYCNILKEGLDAREDGLRWVIKTLWNLEEPVPVSSFPSFLDDESAYFLLYMAQKDLDLHDLQTKLNNLRNQIKNQRRNSLCLRTTKEIYDKFKKRMQDLNNTVVVTQKGLDESYSDKKGTPPRERIRISSHNELNWVKDTLDKLNQEINQKSIEEIERVSVEFENHPSEDVDLLHIIKCLLGDKTKDFHRYSERATSSMRRRNSNF